MHNFKTFINSVDNYRKNAATFYKVDLHVHSHESHDFPKLGDRPDCVKSLLPEDEKENQNPAHHVTFAKQVEDLRIIAITDHNLCRTATEIAKLSNL